MTAEHTYTEDTIKTLKWHEHIRQRPGMYIGRLGDGNQADDGIYVLLKEVLDNSLDEHTMGYGTRIDLIVTTNTVTIRDYGRGIPLSKVIDCVSSINTGAKYGSDAFSKSAGLNGVGTKAVNALSSHFNIRSVREGRYLSGTFSCGMRKGKPEEGETKEANGTEVTFTPDSTIFGGYSYQLDIVEEMLHQYVCLNPALTVSYNGKELKATNGLLDIFNRKFEQAGINPVYQPIHLKVPDVDFAIVHTSQSDELLYSYVNGQNTLQGGTHVQAVRDIIFKSIRGFFKEEFDTNDIRAGLGVILSIRINEPIFESQTKTKLGTVWYTKELALKTWLANVISLPLNDFLHKHQDVASKIKDRILLNKKLREEIQGLKKLSRESSKRVSITNPKLRDCVAHYNTKHVKRLDTVLFITEGDSAAGSITQARDSQTQAVFSLKGKPLNTYGMSKKVIYENEEFSLLHHALGVEEGIATLRYNKVVMATDADVDGMHIRLLLTTYFLQFYPDLLHGGHLYVLETPLFRVRNKKSTHYCYSESERNKYMRMMPDSEVTRFKGLGEISPQEFKQFIGTDIKLTPIKMEPQAPTDNIALLNYFMGKNTPERQTFIINNLRLQGE